MEFRNMIFSLEEIKKTDIVDYLANLGFKSVKVTRNDYWYLSPLRDEKTPSFKINGSLNRRYDFGEGRGGNIIDFDIQYHNCSEGKLLKKLDRTFSFHQATPSPKQQDDDTKKKIFGAHSITSFPLICYPRKRRIPLDSASKFCKEIDYELCGKKYFAIGFQNKAGGYELRSEKFKGISSPKEIT